MYQYMVDNITATTIELYARYNISLDFPKTTIAYNKYYVNNSAFANIEKVKMREELRKKKKEEYIKKKQEKIEKIEKLEKIKKDIKRQQDEKLYRDNLSKCYYMTSTEKKPTKQINLEYPKYFLSNSEIPI